MIFKQLPTMISDLNKLGTALKALDAMKLGTVGVNVANVEAYRTALKGLSVEQSVFALASKGATEEQIRQILVINEAAAEDVEIAMAKAGLTTATKALTQAETVEIATKTGVAKAEAEELLRKIGITATEEGQVVVKKQVTLAMLEQAVASGKITAAESAQIATMLGLNAVESTNIGITNVLTASFAKLWAVITEHPIGAVLTAIGAVAVGTIAYINKANKDAKKALVEAHETAEQALEDTKASLSDDKSELQSINSELETTKQKIQEISSIGTLTLVKQNELNKLSTTNTQLETQRSLLENNIKLKQKSAALDAKKLLETQVEMEYSDILDGSSIESYTELYTYKEHAEYQAMHLQNAYNIYMRALRDGNFKQQQLAQELIDASAGDSAVLTSELLEIIESFKYDDGTIIEGYENLYNEYMGMIYNLQSLTNLDTFLDIAKSVTSNTGIDYEKAVSEAYKLAYEGNFDINKLNQDFVKALSDAGIDESTIDYIFRLKQQEYQLLVDKINDKYKVSEIPDKATVRQDYWTADGAYSEYVEIDVDKETKKRLAEVNTVNERLNEYAKDNPVEFQLVSFFDDNFDTLDKYIEEERIKAENTTDYIGDYITNAIKRIYDEAKSTLNNDIPITPLSTLSISEAVDRIDTRLRPALSSLQSAYQEIFAFDENTGEKIFTPFDEADVTDKFKPVLDALRDLDKIDGINIDYSAYDDFITVLSDTSSESDEVQGKFNKLAAYIINVSDCTNMSAETFNLLAESLTEMGVTNAYEVLNDILELQESLADESINVETAMSGEADALRNLTFASEETAEHLMAYYVQKQIAENPISTLNDILQLENLCNALGVTGEMYETVIALKNAISAKESGAHASGLDKSIEAYQEKLSELASGFGTYNFDFNGANTRSSSSSGQGASRSTPDTFDWTTTAIDHVEKEIEALDEVANSAYSTFSQKNEALAQEIGKVSEEIDLQQQAYANYLNRAEAVGLSDHYKNLIQNGSLGMEDITDETLQNRISEYQKWYDKAQETQDRINDLHQRSNDLHVTSYENCVKELETLRDSQAITEREYLDRMNVLWEKYYANQIEYAVQAKEAKLKLLGAEKDYLESVANAAADILGEQADELKNRQESEIELLEAKKKPLEDQLELLEEQKDKEDRILALQRAQYELKRAESQRSKLTYIDGQMQYRADETNIRDAKNAVDDAEYNIIKADIQDRINAYDKEIAKINERYEAEIANIERLENEWQNALALQERAQNSANFESMFGEGSIAKLLAGDLSMVNTWKQTYLHTLGAIDMVSSGAIGEITAGYAELAGLDLSNISEQTSAVSSQFNSANDAVNRLGTSIGFKPTNSTADGTSPAQAQTEGNSQSLAGALQNTYDIAAEVLPEEVKMMNAITEATNTAIAAINELKSTIESLSTVSANISGMPIYGNAYASGTKRAEKGLALVGEEKPEVILTNDKKAFLAKQPTLLNMEGGETVFDGDATAKMLKAKGFRPITADEFPLLKAFRSYSPDELRQKFAPGLISPARAAASSAIQNANHAVNHSSINNGPTYTTGDVHIHCPGITKDEVAKQIGTELNNVFSGLSLKAYQRASITR